MMSMMFMMMSMLIMLMMSMIHPLIFPIHLTIHLSILPSSHQCIIHLSSAYLSDTATPTAEAAIRGVAGGWMDGWKGNHIIDRSIDRPILL
jgi:hypothetical protein